MFVRKKRNKSGSTSIQIIQKIDGRNKIIKTIGCSNDEGEIESIYHKALYELPRLYGPTLFDPVEEPRISELSNDSIRIIGPDLVFGKIYNSIGYNKFKEPLLKHLVISRITHPGSKLRLTNYLNETGRQSISVYSIYRFLDKLNNKLKEDIEQITFAYTKKIIGAKIGVVFYDITTIYFEASESDDFRITGFSKEGKHQNPQILLGLLVGKNAYPIGYEIFEGNVFEGHTLIPVLERYIERFRLVKPIVIADSGLLSKSNIALLIEKGFEFILGARIKNEKQFLMNKILELNLKDGELTSFIKEDGLVLHVGYSEKRSKKDKFNRQRGIKKLEKSITSGHLTKSNINNRGYNKFLKMEGDISICIDKEKIDYDARWDGLKGYLTNTALSSNDVIENYNNLWIIEKAFRISKTDLKIRPVYHRLKQRIQAHICISFMAYLVYKEFERVLAKNHCQYSTQEAIDQINKIYEVVLQAPYLYNSIKLKNNRQQSTILDIVNQNF